MEPAQGRGRLETLRQVPSTYAKYALLLPLILLNLVVFGFEDQYLPMKRVSRWLAALTLMGFLVLAGAEVAVTARQRERERELLFVGEQYRRAIERYYYAAPPGMPKERLQILRDSFERMLKDPEFIADARKQLDWDGSTFLTGEQMRQKIEASVHVSGRDIFVECHDEDMYAAIDLLIDKLDRQILKHKEKIKSHK